MLFHVLPLCAVAAASPLLRGAAPAAPMAPAAAPPCSMWRPPMWHAVRPSFFWLIAPDAEASDYARSNFPGGARARPKDAYEDDVLLARAAFAAGAANVRADDTLDDTLADFKHWDDDVNDEWTFRQAGRDDFDDADRDDRDETDLGFLAASDETDLGFLAASVAGADDDDDWVDDDGSWDVDDVWDGGWYFDDLDDDAGRDDETDLSFVTAPGDDETYAETAWGGDAWGGGDDDIPETLQPI
ncbi:hypothetical protein M885DRAFT_556571 [Pelagophyceae sp. CCMP2097]|nr:hypothetical protein M885DRAFT_556571 [Pelagophyceae sp. CCMP2097]